MGKEIGKGRSRRRRISAAARFLRREGRKLCAAALCTSLIFGNIANTAVAADNRTDDEVEFELSRGSLYKALWEAVLEGNTVEEDFLIDGEEAESYEELLDADGELYELTSAVKKQDKDLKLRVFARLDRDMDLDEVYEVDGSEEIIFLLTNSSDEMQNAVIYVDEKYTEPIEVLPGKAIEAADDTVTGPAAEAAAVSTETAPGEVISSGGSAGSSSGGGSGSGSGGGTGSGSGSGSSSAEITIDQETDQQESVVEKDSEVSIVDQENGSGTTEDDRQSGADVDIEQDKDTEENKTSDQTDVSGETASEKEENSDHKAEDDSENAADAKDDSDSKDEAGDSEADAGADNADSSEDHADTGSSTEEDADAGNSSGHDTDTGSSTGNDADAGSSSEHDTDTGSGSGNDTDTGNGSGNDTESGNDAHSSADAGSSMASLSVHPVYRVMESAAGAFSKATDSNMALATDSNADEDLLEGDLYGAVRIGNDGAAAFVLDAEELELDDPALTKLSTPSNADYAFTAKVDDIIVHVFADEGVLPEDAELRVTELKEDDSDTADQFRQAKDALDAEGTEYDGMMALDISFFDGDGNEIEPDGNVQVAIEVNTAVLPEAEVPEAVAVHHLAETTDGIQVQTVADMANEAEGTVDVRDNGTVIAAEFEVESFSSFTITWKSGSTTYFTIPVTYMDMTDGTELTGSNANQNFELTDGKSIYFADYAGDVDGYTYLYAYCNGVQASSVKADIDDWGRKLEFYNAQGQLVNEIYEGWGEANVILFYQPKKAFSGTIEAKVYLRYSNELPETINGNDEAGNYGPSGNNTPYITVTVDLGIVSEKSNCYQTGSYYYYSIESDDGYAADADNYSDEKKKQEYLKTEAIRYWDEVIYPAIDEEDRTALDNIFGGEGKYIGYVLKQESDGWHIDGILKDEPPIYVVELYDYTAGAGGACLFAISDNDPVLPGVTYDAFKEQLELTLGGSNYSYTVETYNKVVVQYQKDGYTYQTTVEPGNTYSYIDYSNKRFGYQTMTSGIYYLCQLKMTTERMAGDLVISKTVTGSGKDSKEHFKFTLTGTGLTGTYNVLYNGNDSSCNADHEETITFINGSAEIWLKDGEAVSIRNLPSGQVISIQETPGKYTTKVEVTVDGTTSEANSARVTVGKNTNQVQFTNTQTITSPTGIFMNRRPYLLMLLLAALGITGFTFSGYARRRRKADK